MRNPLIAGFHPDPSVCKVGDDYYVANSTFEYLPGITIFHSTDCQNFELLTHVALRDGQLGADRALTGGGAWAPTIRFHDGTYWLVIPDMMGGRGNVLYTTKDPAGPWSDGIVMDVLGIDPDIAWDDDGTCYVTMSGFILNELNELNAPGHHPGHAGHRHGQGDLRRSPAVVRHGRHVPGGSAPVPHR
jgi:xylan 1,4-beta-xylosidase